MRSSAVRFFRARASMSEKSPPGAGDWNARQVVDSGSGTNPRLRGRYTDPMRSSWPKSESVCSPDFFDRLLQGPAVVHVQTPREQFVTCSPEQSLTDIVHSVTVPYDEYDYLPVVRSSASTQVIGVLCTRSAAKHDGHTRVKDCYEPLAERHLLGANASILEFVLHADCHPCRFIVAGGQISGLVTLCWRLRKGADIRRTAFVS